MKFRVIISILTLIIIALFIIAVTQSYKLKDAYDELQVTYKKLDDSQFTIRAKNIELDSTNKELISTMKELKVYTDEEKADRTKQLNLRKFTIGIDAEAKNADLYKIIAYAIESGFKLEYARKAGGAIYDPVVYYYSDEGKKAAETFAKDLKESFPNISEITPKRGGSSRAGNLITAQVRFNY